MIQFLIVNCQKELRIIRNGFVINSEFDLQKFVAFTITIEVTLQLFAASLYYSLSRELRLMYEFYYKTTNY